MSKRSFNKKLIYLFRIFLFSIYFGGVVMATEEEIINEKFDSQVINKEIWNIVAPEFPYGGIEIIDGKVHLVAKEGQITQLVTKATISGEENYTLEFDMYPILEENSGYGICIYHIRPEGSCYWWLEFAPKGGNSGIFVIYSYSDSKWSPKANLPKISLGNWYRIKIRNEKKGTEFKITNLATGEVYEFPFILHDSGGQGRIKFEANSSGGKVIGVYFDNIVLEKQKN